MLKKKKKKSKNGNQLQKLNDNTVFDGCYIPNKIVIFNRIRGASWFSEMDCKSSYWQIKMDEEYIPLTAFSAPQDIMNG